MLLIVGVIAKPHGVRGEVIVNLRTDEPEDRFAVGSVLSTDSTAKRHAPQPQQALGAQSARGQAEPVAADVPGEVWRTPPTLTVESVRPHQGRLIVTFEGVIDRDQAEELRGVMLEVDSSRITPSEDPDEFHDQELVGLAAQTPEGTHLGEVVRIDHAPAADLLVLRQPDGRNALVPFVKAMVPEVDVPGGRVVLTLPEGLLDL